MTEPNTARVSDDGRSITLPVRVRYAECDPMGFVHHSVYPIWFEAARTELLLAGGVDYADIETAGTLIVVVNMTIRYQKPAKYNQVLDVTATVKKTGGVRIEHEYTVHRDGVKICTCDMTLACIDREGRLVKVPEELRTISPI